MPFEPPELLAELGAQAALSRRLPLDAADVLRIAAEVGGEDLDLAFTVGALVQGVDRDRDDGGQDDDRGGAQPHLQRMNARRTASPRGIAPSGGIGAPRRSVRTALTLSPPGAAARRGRACPRPAGWSTLERAVAGADAVGEAAEPRAGARLRAADAVVADLDDERAVLVREPHGRVASRRAYLATLVSASETVKYAVASATAASRSSGSSTHLDRHRRARRSAATAGARPRSVSTAGWMPRASSRSSAEASESSSPRRSRNGPADSGSRSIRARAIRTSSASVTRRCWAPSWRSRSILRRAASAASTIRAREARSSRCGPPRSRAGAAPPRPRAAR